MKNQILILVFTLIICSDLYGQENSKQYSVSLEAIPLAIMQGNANGLNVGFSIENKKLIHSFSLGFMFSNFYSGHELGTLKVNDTLPARYSTEVDIYTNRPYPLGGVVNDIDLSNLDSYGIKQFTPLMSYRLNRYINYELLYKLIDKRVKLMFGFGFGAGLTNREDTHVGFTGEITNGFNNLTERFWININIRAKYLYLNALSKLVIEYPISKKVNLGLSGGIQYIFDKNFNEDVKIPYLGLSARVKI